MAESMNSFGGDAPNTHVEDFSQHLLDLGSSPSISARLHNTYRHRLHSGV